MNMNKFIYIGLAILVTTTVASALLLSQNWPSKELQLVPSRGFLKVAEPIKEFKILAVGDIMLGRFVETLSNRHGSDYAFSLLDGLFAGHEVVIGNLEGPIVSNHSQTPDFTTSFSFKSSVANDLKSAGFSHLTVANNHTFDRGEGAFAETQKFLGEAGLKYFGHPRKALADLVLKEEVNSVNVIWIGLNEAVSKFFDEFESVKLISELQAEYPDHLIVLNIHWGYEYKLVSNQFQKEFAQKAVAAGADLILGHHPHVVQEVDLIDGKLVFYSLGNFIFDQYFSKDTQVGLAVSLNVSESGIQSAKLIGLEIDKSRPKIMEPTENELFLKELADRSNPNLKDQINAGEINLTLN